MTTIVKTGVLGICLLGISVSPTLAAAGKGAAKSPEQRLAKLDTNGDGALSLEEMKGKGKKDAAKVEKRFKKADKNGDGKVSLEEFKTRGKKSKKNA